MSFVFHQKGVYVFKDTKNTIDLHQRNKFYDIISIFINYDLQIAHFKAIQHQHFLFIDFALLTDYLVN